MTSDSPTRPDVFGIAIDPLDMQRAVVSVFELRKQAPAFVCLAGVHGVIEARRNVALSTAYREAALVLPDGMPTVWVGRKQGFTTMDRVFGPDLMLDVLRASERDGSTHFLVGGKPGVAGELAAELRRRFPAVHIIGTYTPPFRQLTPNEEAALQQAVAQCPPDFLWVGLGTPKQEIFMHKYRHLLAAKVMIGVGAAFDFHTGRIADSPAWIKRAGLQWLHRLWQEPRRLLKRYLRSNSIFLWLLTRQLLRGGRWRSERVTQVNEVPAD